MEEGLPQLKIAVVGAGISGVTAAWALRKLHRVTLFERNDYVGGHTNTITVRESPGRSIPVDTGFIVCNERNYPNFYQLLEQLDIPLRDTEMSFGYCSDSTGISYLGPGIGEFLRLPGSLLQRDFIRILLEQRRFNRRALSDLERTAIVEGTLRDYTREIGCSDLFIEHYLVPISAAIWSSSDKAILDFPTHTFLTFFKNHGMLELSKRPQWQTVIGGSQAYITAFRERFNGKIKTSAAVNTVVRLEDRVRVVSAVGAEDFDRVIFACHADEALLLLSDPSEDEQKLLGSWRYHQNRTVLHSDSSVMPNNRRNWASWNYYRSKYTDPEAPLSATYYMNRLQGIDSKEDYFVTLNNDRIATTKIHYATTYSHPEYTSGSVASQQAIKNLNGSNHTYFCGSYMGYGFHEDGVSSALDVAKLLGGSL